jgi:hypothetical protein
VYLTPKEISARLSAALRWLFEKRVLETSPARADRVVYQ